MGWLDCGLTVRFVSLLCSFALLILPAGAMLGARFGRFGQGAGYRKLLGTFVLLCDIFIFLSAHILLYWRSNRQPLRGTRSDTTSRTRSAVPASDGLCCGVQPKIRSCSLRCCGFICPSAFGCHCAVRSHFHYFRDGRFCTQSLCVGGCGGMNRTKQKWVWCRRRAQRWFGLRY